MISQKLQKTTVYHYSGFFAINIISSIAYIIQYNLDSHPFKHNSNLLLPTSFSTHIFILQTFQPIKQLTIHTTPSLYYQLLKSKKLDLVQKLICILGEDQQNTWMIIPA